ncbi:MAG: hypothetical protein ABSE15_03350 [Candidatus Bathyarchaeia archaeon]
MKMKTPEERNMAMAKAMEMSKLFQEPYYSMIEEILETNQRDRVAGDKMFKEFVAGQNMINEKNNSPVLLTKKQQAWLWNYLKHYDKKIDWMPGADW